MDYELKYVIAICLIVKASALSSEALISSVETEKSKQIPDPVEETLLLPSEETPGTVSGRPNHRLLFNWELGQGKNNGMETSNLKEIKKEKIKDIQSFDTCEHKLKLLESSSKWRVIRKTLHWLGRILASNQTLGGPCRLTKEIKQTPDFHPKNQNINFHPWSKKNISSRETEPVVNLKKTVRYKKPNNHKKGFKTWENGSRRGRNKKEKMKSKRKHHFRKKNSHSGPPTLNATNVLLGVKKILLGKSKNDKCWNPRAKLIKNCGELKEVDENPAERRSRERDHGNNKTNLSKQRPWPHFVYHRVSSKFLHPDSAGQRHSQSAYIAISVVTASKPESADDNDV